MKATIIGAGPAGLAAGTILATRFNADVRILERMPEHEALGLGIGLLSFAMTELRMLDPDNFPTFADACVSIDTVTQIFAGRRGDKDLACDQRLQGTKYWGTRRAAVLAFLKEAAIRAGVTIDYGVEMTPERVAAERATADILVGADGAGSVVRSVYSAEFRPSGAEATSRYAWLELDLPLDHFQFGYIEIPGEGLIRLTAYPHSRDQSSAVITHSAALTGYLDAPGLTDSDGFISDEGLALINDLFAPGLGGAYLKGRSRWRRFRATHCSAAAFANVALVGDAFVTKFYETGWGTSAALQESRILGHMLAHALNQGQTIADGLEVYNRKSLQIAADLIRATSATMQEIDSQGDTFRDLGPVAFLASGAP